MENRSLQIEKYKVEKFKYHEEILLNAGYREKEIKEKFLANRVFYTNKNLLKVIFTKNTKMNIYKTIVRPVMKYAAEIMTMIINE